VTHVTSQQLVLNQTQPNTQDHQATETVNNLKMWKPMCSIQPGTFPCF